MKHCIILIIFLTFFSACIKSRQSPHEIIGSDTIRSSIFIDSISINSSGLISWRTQLIDSLSDFIIEEYRWNDWHTIDYVKNMNSDFYSYQLDTSCDLYQIRIKLKNHPNITSQILTAPKQFQVDKLLSCKAEYFAFTRNTRFKIFDRKGTVLVDDCNDTIDFSTMDTGTYFVAYMNSMEEFVVKKKNTLTNNQ